MAKPDTLIVDGRAFSWQRLCELRREQLEAWKKAEAAAEEARQRAEDLAKQARSQGEEITLKARERGKELVETAKKSVSRPKKSGTETAS